MCPPGVNGVGQVNGPAVQPPVGNPDQAGGAGKAKAANPELPELLKIGKTKRVLMGIFSFGLSEILINDCKAMNADKLHLLNPGLREQEKAQANKANSKLQMALDGLREMPSKFKAAKKAALASVKARFGEQAVPEKGYAEAVTRAEERLRALIEEGDHAITKAEAQRIFEAEYAQSHVEELSKEICRTKMQEQGELPDGSAVTENMAVQVIRNSTEIAQKIAAVQSPEQVAELMEDISCSVDVEMSRRLAFDSTLKSLQEEAAEQLAADYGIDKKSALECVSHIKMRFKESPASDPAEPQKEGPALERDPATGKLTNAEAVIEGIKTGFQAMLQEHRKGLEAVKELNLADSPARTQMLKAAFGNEALANPDVVKLLDNVVKGMDVVPLVEALTAPVPNDADLAREMQKLLTQANDMLVNGLSDLKIGDVSAAQWDGLYNAAMTLLFNSKPVLNEYMTQCSDAFATAMSRLIDGTADVAPADGAIRQFSQAVVQHFWLPGIEEKRQAVAESWQRVMSLQGDKPSEALMQKLTQRQDALRQRFGNDRLPQNPTEAPAWQAMKEKIATQAKAGVLIDDAAVLQAYEDEAQRQMFLQALETEAQRAAQQVEMLRSVSMKELASQKVVVDRLQAVKTPEQFAVLLNDLKPAVLAEVQAQRMVANRCDLPLAAAFATFAMAMPDKTEEELEKMVGDPLRKMVQEKLAEMLETADRSPETGVLTAGASEKIAQALEKLLNDHTNKFQDVLEKITSVPREVQGILGEAVLQGKAFVTKEWVQAVWAVMEMLRAPLVAATEKLANNPGECFDDIRNVMKEALDYLKEVLHREPVAEEMALLSAVILKRVQTPELLERMGAQADGLAMAMFHAYQRNSEQGVAEPNVLAGQFALEFLGAAANEETADRVRRVMMTNEQVEQIKAGHVSEEVKTAMEVALGQLRRQLGKDYVPGDWSLLPSDVMSRLKESLAERAARHEIRSLQDVVAEYVKQTKFALFERAMSLRVKAYADREHFRTIDSSLDIAKKITAEHRVDIDRQLAEMPFDVEQMLAAYDDALRREVGRQNQYEELRVNAKLGIIQQFQNTMPLGEVQSAMNWTPLDEAMRKIFAEAEPNEEGVVDMAQIERQVNECVTNFCGTRVALCTAINNDDSLSHEVKTFLKKAALRNSNFGQPTLQHMKDVANSLHETMNELAQILQTGGEGAVAAFYAALHDAMESIDKQFVEKAGAGADPMFLVSAGNCITTMALAKEPALRAAAGASAIPAEAAMLAYEPLQENATQDQVRVQKLCQMFLTNEQLPLSVRPSVMGFEVL